MKNGKSATAITFQDFLNNQTAEKTLHVYERAIAATSTGIVIADATKKDFPIIYCNPAFERITGYCSTEILGRNCRFLQGPETDTASLAKIRQALQTKQECQVIIKNYRKDGSYFWNELTISPVSDIEGRVTHFIGVQVDITEKQEAQKKLQVQSAAMNASIDGMAIINDRGEFTYINEAYAQIAGYSSPDELIGKNWKIVYEEAELRIFNQYALPIVKKLGKWRGEAIGLRRDNSKYRQELSLSAIRSQMGIICIMRDISDRKQAEVALQQVNEDLERQIVYGRSELRVIIQKLQKETCEHQQSQAALRESEAILRSIVSNLPLILFSINSQGIFTLSEGKGLEPLKLKPQEMVGKSVFDFYSNHPNILNGIRQVLTGKESSWIAEIGDLVYETHATPMKKQNGEVIGLIGMAMDISYHVRTELALRQQAERERLVGAIATKIRRSLNLEEVLNTAVSEVRQFLQTDRVVIYRFEPDWNGVVVVESVSENWMPILGIPIQDPCFKKDYVQLYQQGRIKAIDDIFNSDVAPCHVESLARFQVQANLVVPILQGENLWGLLIAHHCREARKWQESEVTLLRQLSVQIAIAIQQSELYQKLQAELIERKQAEAALRQRETQLYEKALELEQTLYELQKTQSQLIQSEKMSSLGQLVAGVAHEINNPVNFIYGNINPARNYIQDLLDLLNIYQKNCPQKISEIENKIEEIDLEFVKEDLPKLLESMVVGAERIREIVRSLRYFSRHDEAAMKAVDIHEGIDSTLLILQNRIKAKPGYPAIQVIQEYGNLPKVECYAGQLNQVFMNILSNAIDALETVDNSTVISENKESSTTDDRQLPVIRISTEVVGDRVRIRITDNGPGMKEDVHRRLFDPFFTTKPVGKGTGLGLSISYQIVVEKHSGELRCYSQPNQGTEFVIEIPLHQSIALRAGNRG